MKNKIKALVLQRRLDTAGKLIEKLVEKNDYLERRNDKLWQGKLDAHNNIGRRIDEIRNEIATLRLERLQSKEAVCINCGRTNDKHSNGVWCNNVAQTMFILREDEAEAKTNV